MGYYKIHFFSISLNILVCKVPFAMGPLKYLTLCPQSNTLSTYQYGMSFFAYLSQRCREMCTLDLYFLAFFRTKYCLLVVVPIELLISLALVCC